MKANGHTQALRRRGRQRATRKPVDPDDGVSTIHHQNSLWLSNIYKILGVVLLVCSCAGGCSRSEKVGVASQVEPGQSAVTNAQGLSPWSQSTPPSFSGIPVSFTRIAPNETLTWAIQDMLIRNDSVRQALEKIRLETGAEIRIDWTVQSNGGVPDQRDREAILQLLTSVRGFIPRMPGFLTEYDGFAVLVIPGTAEGRGRNVYLIRVKPGDWLILAQKNS
jgi:hypothetical protein